MKISLNTKGLLLQYSKKNPATLYGVHYYPLQFLFKITDTHFIRYDTCKQ